MHKLNRTTITTPGCLSNYDHHRNNWNDVSCEDKALIREKLKEMQGERCAYCEGPLNSLGHHIEHFRRKSLHVTLTFDWTNLYWSCDQYDSCGHYKDNGAGTYSPNELIDPCIHDPDHYFKFRSDGTIDLRQGLSRLEERRGTETLRVFNLDEKYGRLRSMRKCAAIAYIHAVDEILELDPEDRIEFIDAEITATHHLPFSTVVRHLFQAAL